MTTAPISQLRPDEIDVYTLLAHEGTTTSRAWEAIQALNAYLQLKPTPQQQPKGARLLTKLQKVGWTSQGEIRWNIIVYEEIKAQVRLANSLGVEVCQYILRTMPQPVGNQSPSPLGWDWPIDN